MDAPDPRDQEFRVTPILKKRKLLDALLPLSRTYALAVPPFDQFADGNTDWCTAAAWYHFFLSEPFPTLFPFIPADLIDLAKTVDEWTGEEYWGTSHRAVAKVLEKLGYISPYLWAKGVDEMRIWLLAGMGPLIIGMEWTENMYKVDKEGFIHLGGKATGGHCTLISGWSDILDAVLITNSMGPKWGKGGQAWMRIADFRKLNVGEDALALTCETKYTPKRPNWKEFEQEQRENALYMWENPRPMDESNRDFKTVG